VFPVSSESFNPRPPPLSRPFLLLLTLFCNPVTQSRFRNVHKSFLIDFSARVLSLTSFPSRRLTASVVSSPPGWHFECEYYLVFVASPSFTTTGTPSRLLLHFPILAPAVSFADFPPLLSLCCVVRHHSDLYRPVNKYTSPRLHRLTCHPLWPANVPF
jgi:hypothetical protein